MSSESTSKSPQCLPKQGISRQLASNTLAAIHRRYNCPGPPTHARPLVEFRASANRAMDLLRQNIQSSITKEINDVLKKYLEKFFVPAVANIRSNLGDDSVGEDQIRAVCRAMLDATRTLYAAVPRAPISPGDCSDSELICTNDPQCNRTNSSISFNKRNWDIDFNSSSGIKQKRLKPLYETENGVSSSSIGSNGQFLRTSIRQFSDPNKWNPERLTEDTVFVMGSQAQKLLGLGQSRGRLYSKHADLMRYPADSVDREWISNNCLMSTVGGKPYIMVLEDIEELAMSEQYRNIADLRISELNTFRVPPFIISKMKAYLMQRNVSIETMSSASSAPSTPTSLDNALSEYKSELFKAELKEDSSKDIPLNNSPILNVNISKSNEDNDHHIISFNTDYGESKSPHDFDSYKIDAILEPVLKDSCMYVEFKNENELSDFQNRNNKMTINLNEGKVKCHGSKGEQSNVFVTCDSELLTYEEPQSSYRNDNQSNVAMTLDDITLATEDFQLYSRVEEESAERYTNQGQS